MQRSAEWSDSPERPTETGWYAVTVQAGVETTPGAVLYTSRGWDIENPDLIVRRSTVPFKSRSDAYAWSEQSQ